MKAEYVRLSEWVRKTRKTHGQRVVIHVVDPQSLAGFWRVIKHRIRRYPTFLVDGGDRIVGWEGDPDGALGRALARQSGSVPQEARA